MELKINPDNVRKVGNPLPVPTICRYCGSAVNLVHNQEIYGTPTGKWPYAYRCEMKVCNAYVGLHPFTDIPLGTLARQELRTLRSAAKSAFNPLFEQYPLSRNQAYAFLAKEMNISLHATHIGWFDEAQCKQAIVICRTEIARRGRPTKEKKVKYRDKPQDHAQRRIPDWFDERDQYL